MKHEICAIRDRAVDAFLRPFFATHLGGAKRSFRDEVNRAAPDNAMHAHPEDYDLYHLGSFDDNTGLFESHTPRQIEIGKDCVDKRA